MLYDKMRQQFSIHGKTVTAADPWFIHLLRMQRDGTAPSYHIAVAAGKEMHAIRVQPTGEFHIAPKGGGFSVRIDEDCPALYAILSAHFKCGSTVDQLTLVTLYVHLQGKH